MLEHQRFVVDLSGRPPLPFSLPRTRPVEIRQSLVCLGVLRVVTQRLGVKLDRLSQRKRLLALRFRDAILDPPGRALAFYRLPTFDLPNRLARDDTELLLL